MEGLFNYRYFVEILCSNLWGWNLTDFSSAVLLAQRLLWGWLLLNLTPPSSHSVYVDELVFSYGLKMLIPAQVSKQHVFSCQNKTCRTLESTQFGLLPVCVRATEWFKTLWGHFMVWLFFTYSAKEHTLQRHVSGDYWIIQKEIHPSVVCALLFLYAMFCSNILKHPILEGIRFIKSR